MSRHSRQWLSAWLLILAAVNLSGCAYSLFYYPNNKDYGHSPAASGLQYERVEFASRDGTRLTGWFVPAVGVASAREAVGTVIHVHGNAGNMSAQWQQVEWLPARGFNVFMFDYRGYGASAGRPNPKGLFEDTQSAIDYVRNRPDVNPQRLVVLGQSLGGNNAIAAVGAGDRAGIHAMAIDSTFFSYSAIADDTVSGAGALFSNDYSASRYIAAIDPIPLLLLHGTADRVVPYHHSQDLYAVAGGPKRLILIPGGRHVDAFSSSHGNQYRDVLETFFRTALATRPDAVVGQR